MAPFLGSNIFLRGSLFKSARGQESKLVGSVRIQNATTQKEEIWVQPLYYRVGRGEPPPDCNEIQQFECTKSFFCIFDFLFVNYSFPQADFSPHAPTPVSTLPTQIGFLPVPSHFTIMESCHWLKCESVMNCQGGQNNAI